MSKAPPFAYWVEVVTDAPLHPELSSVQTPCILSFRTRTRLRTGRCARRGLTASEAPDDAWIVHLLEETQPTASGIKGIAKLVGEEESSGELRIGQGAILDHRDWKKHPFLTLADSVRTGDDFARIYLQHRIGVTLFGLHGSYIVCRNDVEKSVGFDFGPAGSITEDAFWALKAMEMGWRARWCEGFLEEDASQLLRHGTE